MQLQARIIKILKHALRPKIPVYKQDVYVYVCYWPTGIKSGKSLYSEVY